MPEMEKVCGIYSITHKKNGKVYIGKSIDIYKRASSHIHSLNTKKHINTILQEDWNECGIDGFEFRIVERCKVHNLQMKEQFYIDKFNSKNTGYNQVDALYDPDNYVIKNFALTFESHSMLLELCKEENTSRNTMINEIIKYCYNNASFEFRNDPPCGYEIFFRRSKRKRHNERV